MKLLLQILFVMSGLCSVIAFFYAFWFTDNAFAVIFSLVWTVLVWLFVLKQEDNLATNSNK